MNIFRGIACYFLSLVIYLLLSLIEYFTVYILIRGLNLYFFTETLMVIIGLFLINPLITSLIMTRVNLYPKEH